MSSSDVIPDSHVKGATISSSSSTVSSTTTAASASIPLFNLGIEDFKVVPSSAIIISVERMFSLIVSSTEITREGIIDCWSNRVEQAYSSEEIQLLSWVVGQNCLLDLLAALKLRVADVRDEFLVGEIFDNRLNHLIQYMLIIINMANIINLKICSF